MLKGIDVYKDNGKIDWPKVKESGIDFAMIKASQGRGEGAATKSAYLFPDANLSANLIGATEAGIQCGVWHWLTAKTVHEAKVEADYFIETIRQHKKRITLWAAVDVESPLLPTSKTLLTAIVKAFMERVEAAGYKPMLYTNPNFLTYRYTPGAFDDADIWLAHHGAPKPMNVPNLKIWQHTSVGTEADVARGWALTPSGRIPGINAACDVNVGYFDIADLANPVKPVYKVGGKYTIRPGDVYINGKAVPERLIGQEYTIQQVQSDRILLREIVSWVKA